MKRTIILTIVLSFIASGVYGQTMQVKNSSATVLMKVNDETGTSGAIGSIELPQGTVAPGTTTNKLYNVGGSLYWSGSELGLEGSAGGWTDDGTVVRLSLSTDKVGIGTTSPEFKLTLDNDGGIIAKGNFNSGATLSTSGGGTRLMWYPRKAAFRAGYVNSSHWDSDSIGNYSAASGYNTKAKGPFSTAMGQNTTASGNYSTAMGYQTTASGSSSLSMGYQTTSGGSNSMAMGYQTTASGNLSTTMGYGTSTNSLASLAIGRYNVGGGTAALWIDTDPLFEIGIGTSPSTRANAVTVLKDGNVGIGMSDPDAELEVNGKIKITGGSPGSGKVLTSDANGLGSWKEGVGGWTDGGANVYTTNSMDMVCIGTATPEFKLTMDNDGGIIAKGMTNDGAYLSTSGGGTRLMWYPRKSAFRVGSVVSTNWDADSIGTNSMAFGNNTKAKGGSSTAMGISTTASGFYSTAMGYQTTSSSNSSTAMGYQTTASGSYSTAMGRETTASGQYSTAMGYQTTASGNASVAMGYQTTSSAYSTAMGYNTTISGPYSTAMGSYVSTSGSGSMIIGDNSTVTTLSNSTNNIFVSRFENGYTLYTNSSATVGVQVGAGGGSWSSISDSTKKENYKPVDGEAVLEKIRGFRLGSWNYKGQDPSKYRHYGPMAQDFFSAFGHDGIGTVGNDTLLSSADVDGIHFIAIQALEKRTAEQRSEIAELKALVSDLKAENAELKSMVAGLCEKFEKEDIRITSAVFQK